MFATTASCDSRDLVNKNIVGNVANQLYSSFIPLRNAPTSYNLKLIRSEPLCVTQFINNGLILQIRIDASREGIY